MNKRLIALIILPILTGLIAFLLQSPNIDLRIKTVDFGSQINLSAEKSLFSNCVNVHWELEHIESVYLNEQAVIGFGDKQLCDSGADRPRFTVFFPNGIHKDYVLETESFAHWAIRIVSISGLLSSIIFGLFSLYKPTRYRIFFIMLSVSSALALAFLFPSPENGHSEIIEQFDNTDVYIHTNYRYSVLPEECIKIDWQIAKLSTSSENQPASLISDSIKQCAGDTPFQLHVVSDSGQEQTYHFDFFFLFPDIHINWFYLINLLTLLFLIGCCCVICYSSQSLINLRENSYLYVGLAILTILLWLPFAWNMVPHRESWDIFAYIEGVVPTWFTDSFFSVRPFHMLPHSLAHLLNPNSFIPLNLINMLLWYLSALTLYHIQKAININAMVAVAGAVLLLIYPLNPLKFSARSIPLIFNLGTFLGAVLCLIWYQKSPSRICLVLMWLMLAMNVGSYESAYVLILLVAGLILYSERQNPIKAVHLAAYWLLIPAIRVFWTVLLPQYERGFYLSTSLDSMAGNPTNEGQSILEAFLLSYKHAFGDLIQEFGNLSFDFVVFAGIFVFIFIILMYRASKQGEIQINRRLYFQFSALAFICIGLGLGILIFLQFYRFDTWRPYFYPLVASASFISLITAFTLTFVPIKKYYPYLFMIIMAGFSFFSVNWTLEKHQMIASSSEAKRRFITSIVEQVGEIDNQATILILTTKNFEEVDMLGLGDLASELSLNSALKVIYEGQIYRAEFCFVNRFCELQADGVMHATIGFIPYENVILFNLEEDARATLIKSLSDSSAYQPALLYDTTAPLAPRAYSILSIAESE